MRKQRCKLLRASVLLLTLVAATKAAGHSSKVATRAQKSRPSAPRDGMEPYRYTNRLIHAKSPYLLLHAHNPLD